MFVYRDAANANVEKLRAAETARSTYRNDLSAQIKAARKRRAESRKYKEDDRAQMAGAVKQYSEDTKKQKEKALADAALIKSQLRAQIDGRTEDRAREREAREAEDQRFKKQFERESQEEHERNLAEFRKKKLIMAKQMEDVRLQLEERKRIEAANRAEMVRLAMEMHQEQQRQEEKRRQEFLAKQEMNKKRLEQANRGWASEVAEVERKLAEGIESDFQKQLREKEAEEKRRKALQLEKLLDAREWCRNRIEQKEEERQEERRNLKNWRKQIEADASTYESEQRNKKKGSKKQQAAYAAALDVQVGQQRHARTMRKAGDLADPVELLIREDFEKAMANPAPNLAAISYEQLLGRHPHGPRTPSRAAAPPPGKAPTAGEGPETAGGAAASTAGPASVHGLGPSAVAAVPKPVTRNALSVAGMRAIQSDDTAAELLGRAQQDPRFFSMGTNGY